MSSNTPTITRQLVAEDQRTNVTADLFGVYFPIQLELFIFSMASRLSEDYGGGYWLFYSLDNGGFYMAPDSEGQFQVTSENGSEGSMSSDAFGITVCLFGFSNLSFGSGQFAETCAEQFHLLREFMMDHAEAGAILAATD
jgi:Antirestriction protein